MVRWVLLLLGLTLLLTGLFWAAMPKSAAAPGAVLVLLVYFWEKVLTWAERLRNLIRGTTEPRPQAPQASASAGPGSQVASHTGSGDIVQVKKGIGKAGQAIYIEKQTVIEQQTVIPPPRPSPLREEAPSGLPPLRSEVYIPRGIEERVLKRLSQDRAVAIVGMTGPGGVGKTHSAWHIARELKRQGRVAAIFWVDLKDRDIETILLDYATQVGLDARDLTPEQTLVKIRGRLNARCQEQPVLVVLDDVRPAHLARLKRLLPPAPCLGLVTSRVRNLPLPTEALDVMDEAQARALLREILGEAALEAEPKAVADLLALTHRHPLALDVAARRIRQRMEAGYPRPIATFVAELRKRGLDALTYDRAVAEVLRVSYAMLDPELQRAFRWLGVFAASGFTVAEAAGLWRVPEDRAAEWLQQMVDLSLARLAPPRADRPDLPTVPRYALHDLLHDLAQTLLEEHNEADAAYRALAEYYLQEFSKHKLPNPVDASHLAHAFENLARVAGWARARGDADLLARLATVPRNWLGGVYHRWDAWRAWLTAARDLGIRDPHLRAQVLKAIGDVLQFQKDLEEAMAHYRQALDIFHQVDDQRGQANTLRAMGDVLQFQGNLEGAMGHYRQALALFEQVGSHLGQANTLQAMGDVLRFQDDLEGAMRHYRQALGLFEQVGFRLAQANTLRAMGDVLQFQDDLEGAMGHYRQALDLYRQIGDRLGQANVLADQSLLALQQGDDTRAQDLLAQAVDLHQSIGDRYSVARDYFRFGLVLRALGRADEARPYFLQAAALYDEIGFAQYADEARQLVGEGAED